MRRVGSRETRDPVDAVIGLRIGMSRFRLGLAVVAMTMTVVFTAGGGVANAAPIPGETSQRVRRALTTGTHLHVDRRLRGGDFAPDGSQRRHGGRRRARDHRHRPRRRTSFNGGVVTNAPGAHLMHVNNVIIQAVGFAFHGLRPSQAPGAQLVQVGLFFDDADGTATDVTVRDITQHSGCQTGNGIRANARRGTARTVTLTHVTVTGFQKNGVTGSGQMTLNVGGNSTIGPPDAPAGCDRDQQRPVRGRRRWGHVHGQHGDRLRLRRLPAPRQPQSCCPVPPT